MSISRAGLIPKNLAAVSMPPKFLAFALLLSVSLSAHADKVIMKDGKIYQGHVLGETSTSVLISNPPVDPKPRFLNKQEVMTIVRESRPEEKEFFDERRFPILYAALKLHTYSSKEFSFSPAPGLTLGGGFRIFPALEVVGEFTLVPQISNGDLVVTDGTTTRRYEDFYAYQGGFSGKIFPFYKRPWRLEPYLGMGYHWAKLTPKASGDSLSGHTLSGGAGVMLPWWKPLYWDFRFMFEQTEYRRIQFLGNSGSLSGVSLTAYVLSAGLAWRFL
jgi:hypothetical protein